MKDTVELFQPPFSLLTNTVVKEEEEISLEQMETDDLKLPIVPMNQSCEFK